MTQVKKEEEYIKLTSGKHNSQNISNILIKRWASNMEDSGHSYLTP